MHQEQKVKISSQSQAQEIVDANSSAPMPSGPEFEPDEDRQQEEIDSIHQERFPGKEKQSIAEPVPQNQVHKVVEESLPVTKKVSQQNFEAVCEPVTESGKIKPALPARETGELMSEESIRPAKKIKNPQHTWSKLDMENLKKIGSKSLQHDIRIVGGSATDAWEFFKAQVEGFTECKPGVYIGVDANKIRFTYRATSKSEPPTIDVNGIKGLRKIKFINTGL